jgi:hypothetical protein
MNNALAKCVTVAVLGLGVTTSAHAIDTLVQLNYDGIAGYDVTGINEFDWQSSGDLIILDELIGGGSTANGTNYTSFFDWAANAVIGDTVTFALNAQARLNDLLDDLGGSIAPPELNTSGSGAGFEITAALTGSEVGTLVAPGVLAFSGVTGAYEYFFDTSPNSNVDAGTGFTDGISFLSGTLGPAGPSGSFTFGVGGSSILRNTVTSYDSAIIETDPEALAPLVGTTFDTLISFISNGEAHVCEGCPIGLNGYLVQELDLAFKADANTEFTAEPRETPVPGTLFMLGLGLLGVHLSRRKPLA